MSSNPYITAVHEAGHALMALMLGECVTEIVVHDYPDHDERLGHCRHTVPADWRNGVWITLAGPVATAIHDGRSGVETFTFGDASDVADVWRQCLNLVCRPLPQEFHDVAGDDHQTFMELVCDGWRPPGIKGQAKRRLTLYAKDYALAADFAHDMLHREKDQVRVWIEERPWFMRLVRQMADEAMSKRRMDAQDISAFIKRLAASDVPVAAA